MAMCAAYNTIQEKERNIFNSKKEMGMLHKEILVKRIQKHPTVQIIIHST
jgi:hypothetical protein